MSLLTPHRDDSGTTPVSPDEERFLIPSVSTLAELNLLERENILEARRWLFSPRRKFTPTELLDHLLVRELHRRMFRHIWRWAGKLRDCELNLGVPPVEVGTRLVSLLEDARAWISYDTFPADELCVRLHHGLVAIHPWRNGNGRHARLVADRLAVALGRSVHLGRRHRAGSEKRHPHPLPHRPSPSRPRRLRCPRRLRPQLTGLSQ